MEALKKIFGEVEVSTVPLELPRDPGDAAKAIMEAAAGYDEVEVVAPLPTVQAVLNRGIRPLKAVVESDRNGGFSFSHYERILEVKVVSEPL